MIDPLDHPHRALAIPIIVVPAELAFKHAAKLRDLEHAERMRALELGRFNPGDEDVDRRHARLGAEGSARACRSSSMIAAMVATLETGFHRGDLDDLRHGRRRRA